MSINSQNLCDDWGWYVDIENTNHLTNNITSNFVHTSTKNFSLYLNKLNTIEEFDDEYDYYIKNHKHIDEEVIDERILNEKLKPNNLFIIGSKTMITVLLTYIIFFIL
jgi:hypothetical protein